MIIESCPSSNSRIGASLSPEDNPLRFFIAQGIKVVLGSDDPGIFASDWQQEEALAAHLSGEREIFAKNAELLRSQTLFNPMR
jgi:adenosine deaminase